MIGFIRSTAYVFMSILLMFVGHLGAIYGGHNGLYKLQIGAATVSMIGFAFFLVGYIITSKPVNLEDE